MNTRFVLALLVGSLTTSLTAQPCATAVTRVAIEHHPIVVEAGSARAALRSVHLRGEPIAFPLVGQLPAAGEIGSSFAYRSRSDGRGCRSILTTAAAPDSPEIAIPYTTYTLQPDAGGRVTFTLTGPITEVIQAVSLSLFRDRFDPEVDNCPRFVTSSFAEAGNRTALTAKLTGGQTYVLVVQPGQSSDRSSPRPYSIDVRADSTEVPRFFSGGSLPAGTAYTYLAIRAVPDALVAAVSATGDFRALGEGEYVIYGLQHGNDDDPQGLEDMTLEEVRERQCIRLSENWVEGLLVVGH